MSSATLPAAGCCMPAVGPPVSPSRTASADDVVEPLVVHGGDLGVPVAPHPRPGRAGPPTNRESNTCVGEALKRIFDMYLQLTR